MGSEGSAQCSGMSRKAHGTSEPDLKDEEEAEGRNAFPGEGRAVSRN